MVMLFEIEILSICRSMMLRFWQCSRSARLCGVVRQEKKNAEYTGTEKQMDR